MAVGTLPVMAGNERSKTSRRATHGTAAVICFRTGRVHHVTYERHM